LIMVLLLGGGLLIGLVAVGVALLVGKNRKAGK